MLKNCYKIKTTVYRNGSISRDSVPLWKGPASEEPSGRSITQVNMETVYRNGSVSRDSVPLWKDPASERSFRGPMTQVPMMTVHHNGSVSRDSVPLWKDSVFSSPLNGREKCIIFYKLIIVL